MKFLALHLSWVSELLFIRIPNTTTFFFVFWNSVYPNFLHELTSMVSQSQCICVQSMCTNIGITTWLVGPFVDPLLFVCPIHNSSSIPLSRQIADEMTIINNHSNCKRINEGVCFFFFHNGKCFEHGSTFLTSHHHHKIMDAEVYYHFLIIFSFYIIFSFRMKIRTVHLFSVA